MIPYWRMIIQWGSYTRMKQVESDRKVLRVRPPRGVRIRLDPKPGSPDPEDYQQTRRWLQALPRPWAVDLYSGAGGLSLGLAKAGFSVIAAADHDATALETHEHNIGGLTWCGDLGDPLELISQLARWGINSVDLVAGGPPCQPFSRAGTPKIADLVRRGVRPPGDERTSLWRSFLAVIDHLDARVVLLENVPDFVRIQSGHTLTTLLSELEDRGFSTYVEVLESWRYGVPQLRKRLFVIGIREGVEFRWPEPSGIKPTVGDAIADLPLVEGGQREETLPYRTEPLGEFARKMRRDLVGTERNVIRDHVTRFVRDDDAAIFKEMKPGQTYRDVPEHLRRYRSDIFSDKYNRLTWEGLSRTITAHMARDGYWYIHPSQDRTLSIREAARIQTFPDSFRFAGFPSSRYRQIGNAVPPSLAERVGRSLRRSLVTVGVRESGVAYGTAPMRDSLMEWYGADGRSYVWRQEEDPWIILLAEVCLRRTQADQVARIFPSLKEMGNSPTKLLEHRDDVRGLLYHLGIGQRVDHLFDTAERVIHDHGGEVPKSYEELVQLPGVGDYIASAVLCFAFGQPTTLLDTNTGRFAGRYVGRDNLAPWQKRLTLHQLARPGDADADWNYALLDLGALVCGARRPDCASCPVRPGCSTGLAWMANR